jgi:hypothetical protein
MDDPGTVIGTTSFIKQYTPLKYQSSPSEKALLTKCAVCCVLARKLQQPWPVTDKTALVRPPAPHSMPVQPASVLRRLEIRTMLKAENMDLKVTRTFPHYGERSAKCKPGLPPVQAVPAP